MENAERRLSVRKRHVGLAVAVLVGAAAVLGPSFPPEVEELLPHTVVLREISVIDPSVPQGAVLLGVHDLSGDGLPDLVVASDRRVQVMFGDGQGGFSAGPWVYLEVGEYSDGEQMPGRSVTTAGETYWNPYELEKIEGKTFVPNDVVVHTGVLVDLDGDGILDLAVRGYGGGPTEDRRLRLYLLRGLGGGEFARAGSVAYPAGVVLSGLRAVDGEVLLTVAGRDEPTRLYRVSASDGLESPALEKLAEGAWTLRWAGDVTGEGTYDLVVSDKDIVQILILDGEGGFREGPQFSPVAGDVRGVELADLDGDGSLDLVIRTPTGVITALWRGAGYAEAFSRDFGVPLSRHALADLTGDGIPDLLVQRSTGFSEYYLLPGDGHGGFLEPVAEFAVLDGLLMEPHFADLNADSLLDIVFARFGGGQIRVYLNGGTLPGTSLHPLPGAVLAVGDLSGNGRPDILTADVGSQGVGAFWNDGRGGLIYRPLAATGRLPMAGALSQGVAYVLLPPTERTPAELVAVESTGRILGLWWVSPESLPMAVAADLDGDGEVDVAIPAKGELLVLWGGGALRAYLWPEGEVSLLAPVDGGLWAVSIGEYADLVEVRFTRRELTVFAPLLQLEALPLAMTTGDLDRDGIPDPVVLAIELGAKAEDDEVMLFVERVVAGMALSSTGPVVEEVPGFQADEMPWPFSGAAVGSIAREPHLVYTTSAGGGVFLVPWAGGWGEPVRVDLPGGPLALADLDGNGEPEILTATVGLGSLLAVLWNGGGR